MAVIPGGGLFSCLFPVLQYVSSLVSTGLPTPHGNWGPTPLPPHVECVCEKHSVETYAGWNLYAKASDLSHSYQLASAILSLARPGAASAQSFLAPTPPESLPTENR